MPRKWIIVTIGVVLALLVADVVVASVANRRAGDALASAQHLSSRPYVHINGWPFVVKAVRGRYGSTTVIADPARTSGDASLEVHPLRLTVRDMHSSGGFGHITARSAEGTARIGYRSLSQSAGRRLVYVGGGRLTSTVRVVVSGRTYRPTVSAEPKVEDGGLVLRDVTVAAQRGLPASGLTTLRQRAEEPIELGRFPFGVHPSSLYLTPEGITFRVSGRDLVLNR